MATRTLGLPPSQGKVASGSLSAAYGPARSTIQGTPLNAEELRKTHAYWRACNYLSLGMIYLQDNPLLQEPLQPQHMQEPPSRTLGRKPGPVLCLHSPQPVNQEI